MKAKTTSRQQRIPKLRHHKASGQGYVVLNDQAVYLGKFDLPDTRRKYHQIIAEWVAAGGQMPVEADSITITELLGRFWRHAEKYYITHDGRPTSELETLRMALRPLKALYGHAEVSDFGPRALRTTRQKMIELGWCRNTVNKSVGRIKRVFRWAAEQELVPGSAWHSLQAVTGLRHRRSQARESEPVKPVPQERVDAVGPYVSRQVWAMIQLQLFTAARSGEIVIMRPCDVDTSGKIWFYRPSEHKTAHHGHERRIYIGPRGQKVLAPFLLRDPQAFCFSPAEARAEYLMKICNARKTPPQRGNGVGTNRKTDPKKQPGERYATTSYGYAIRKAIKKAFRPEGMSEEEFKTWKAPQHWHPHQLRHNAATELRKEFGLEAARIILGHRSAAITEVYAELDQRKAVEAMLEIG